MFRYHVFLAARNVRRQKVLTGMMMLAMGVGIGTSAVMQGVRDILSGSPIPDRENSLYKIGWIPTGNGAKTYWNVLLPIDVATQFASASSGAPHVLMAQGSGNITVDRKLAASNALLRATTHDFFSMFEVPIAFGRAWDELEDANAATVAIVSKGFAEKHFGDSANAFGKTIGVGDVSFVVVGVIGEWKPTPRYYDMSVGAYGPMDDVYLPFSTTRFLGEGVRFNYVCNGTDFTATNVSGSKLSQSSCAWVSFWLYLKSSADAISFGQFLENFQREMRSRGKASGRSLVTMTNVKTMLADANVVPGYVILYAWLSAAFLLICTANSSAILLARYLSRDLEIGVRRALGASRRQIFLQLQIESAIIGLGGGAIGVAISAICIIIFRTLPAYYAELIRPTIAMIAFNVLFTFITGLGSGLIPAFRASRIDPSLQIKSG